MIKYIFWDFNGTILDDRILCWNLLNELLVSENEEEVTYLKYLDVFGFPIKEYYQKAGIQFKYRTFKEMSDWFINKYQPLSLKQSLYPGVEKTLIKAKELGIENICLSASLEDNLKEQLTHFKIDKHFKDILGTNNVLAIGKKDVAEKYIKDNNINVSECLLIGDTSADYELAKGLNITPILFTGGHQSKERLNSLDALIIDNIEDLIIVIEGKEEK